MNSENGPSVLDEVERNLRPDEKVVYVSFSQIMHLIVWNRMFDHVVCTSGVPEDTVLVGVADLAGEDSIAIIVKHPFFADLERKDIELHYEPVPTRRKNDVGVWAKLRRWIGRWI